MKKYRGKYVFGGTKSGEVLDQLQPGDELSLIGAFGKVSQLKILESYQYNNQRVYVTDGMGLIYADEVVPVRLPAWKQKRVTQSAQVV
ncbi:hypothetical protein JOD24_000302 [Kroppenstedtia sanguinis]|uniref:Uncharacterized protein n=1 Tax=Kroppenstedtia sanguinis TaxID=1380684 RepID=A0ABW4C6C6_9BACL